MKTMNDIDVVINNKKYTLSGYESDSYLQMVAAYINDKTEEFKQKDFFNRLDQDMKNILLELNIADDFFKAKNQVKTLEAELDKKNSELFDMKHDLISMQSRLDSVQKELQSLKFENLEGQKKIVKLETELSERTERSNNKKK